MKSTVFSIRKLVSAIAYHSTVPCFGAGQVSNNSSAEADVPFANATNYPGQKEHAETPRDGPDRVGGHEPQLEHKQALN